MSSSKSSVDDILGESWVDVDTRSLCSSQGGSMMQLGAEEMRLLREAQRESNQSSARVSLAGSRRDSPHSSPKSPPNSPVQGNAQMVMEWHSYYINPEMKDAQTSPFSMLSQETDVLSEWSSRPDSLPPKNWTFRVPKRDGLSIRSARLGDASLFSRKGMYALFVTNILSLILGTGVGLWLCKCGYFVPSIKVR